jgi:hypothetical protein
MLNILFLSSTLRHQLLDKFVVLIMFSVLLLGATGYLGGTVLTDLERAAEFDITCLVRPNKKSLMSERRIHMLMVSLAVDPSLTILS